MKLIGLSIVSCFVLGAGPVHASSWQPIGTRWIEVYDETKLPSAIYDLSYPSMFGPIPLGKIDPNFSLSKVLGELKQKIAETSTHGITPEEREFLKTTKDFPEASVPTSLQSTKWWRDIPWKSSHRNVLLAPPKSFRLSDIDFAKATPKSAKFETQLKELEATHDSNGRSMLGTDILKQFVFVRDEDGLYQIQWNPPAGLDRPLKVVDFKNPKSQLYENLAWDSLHTAIGLVLGTIDIPVVAAIAGTAIDLAFFFQEQMLTSHQEMFNELIYSVVEGSDTALPLAQFPVAKLEQVKAGLFYSESHLGSIAGWIASDASSGWKKKFQLDSDRSQRSLEWLVQNQSGVQSLNTRFASANGKIFLLPIATSKSTAQPAVGVDFFDHQRIRETRSKGTTGVWLSGL